MDLQVFASPELAAEAKRFLAPFAVVPFVSSLRSGPEEPLRAEKCLLYLSGDEGQEQLSRSLKALARSKGRVSCIVLYARRAEHRRVVDWARVVERVLPKKTEFCFSATDVARALKLRNRSRTKAERHAPNGRVAVEAVRAALGLTQGQLASAIGVSERTVQNWEAGRISTQAARRLRDLVELREMLARYLAPDALPHWLISPNDAFAGQAPRDWIIEGRARDLLWEVRRMQVGEPA